MSGWNDSERLAGEDGGLVEEEARQYRAPTLRDVSPESLERLLEISIRLSSTYHLEDLLLMVMDVATELTNTEKASILLVNESTGQLFFAASTAGEVPQDIVVPLDSSIAGWVVRNGRSLVLGDVQTDNRFYATVDRSLQFVTRSMLAVPLVTKKGVIGALEVLNKLDEGPYTEQDIALMEALASQSAVAIVNAHLFHQSDLLAEIMHEIKTPLMAITAASELMLRPDVPVEKHAELARMIQRESMRLSRMSMDFLEFARLESGRVRLKRKPVDVFDLVEEVVRIAQPQAAAKGLTLQAELPEETEARAVPELIGDHDRLKQVLLNLVSNAIKYNVDHGRIVVRVIYLPDEVVISVTDTGRGIEPRDIERLFDRFYRIPTSEDMSEGSGMGLAIAKKIVEAHDGRIEVESIVGEGTTFTVILPLATNG